ncbi:MAG: putative manganese efflux pump MntP [Candidatus Dichloromethanomonas elyunquensis]|nr:MAG: putative manganese efflux pump MntP [Candidatus Dichloromethanomonas elyunquensis]
MAPAWVIAVSVALGMDAFSFSLALGLVGIRNRTAVQLVFTIALFHVIMPLLGIWAGQELGGHFGNLATGMGTVILLWLGSKMLLGALRGKERRSRIPSLKGLGIYALAGSVSLDALSVGFSLGTFVSQIVPATLMIGFTAGMMTGGGILLGRRMGTWLGNQAEGLGGIILLLIGIRMGMGLIH